MLCLLSLVNMLYLYTQLSQLAVTYQTAVTCMSHSAVRM